MTAEEAKRIIEQGTSHPDYDWAVRVNATSYRNLGRADGVDPDPHNRNSTGGRCLWALAGAVLLAAAIVAGTAFLAFWLANQ